MDYDDGVEFVKQQFFSVREDQTKFLYVHITCATDPKNVANLFHSMREIVVREQLTKSGFI